MKCVRSLRCNPCARKHVGDLLRGGGYVVPESRGDKEQKVVSPWDIEKSNQYLSRPMK